MQKCGVNYSSLNKTNTIADQIAELIYKGYSNRSILIRIYCSKHYVRAIRSKLKSGKWKYINGKVIYGEFKQKPKINNILYSKEKYITDKDVKWPTKEDNELFLSKLKQELENGRSQNKD